MNTVDKSTNSLRRSLLSARGGGPSSRMSCAEGPSKGVVSSLFCASTRHLPFRTALSERSWSIVIDGESIVGEVSQEYMDAMHCSLPNKGKRANRPALMYKLKSMMIASHFILHVNVLFSMYRS